jgi:hypothetical protein
MTPHRGQDTTEDVRDEARHCRCSQHQQVPCACHWESRIVWVNDIGATLWSPTPLVNRNFPWKTVYRGGHTSTPDGLAGSRREPLDSVCKACWCPCKEVRYHKADA